MSVSLCGRVWTTESAAAGTDQRLAHDRQLSAALLQVGMRRPAFTSQTLARQHDALFIKHLHTTPVLQFEGITRLVSRLSNAGYVVVTAHTRQTFPFPNENDDGATLNWCPEEQLVRAWRVHACATL